MAKKHFSPRLIPLLVTIAMLIALIGLGIWQMGRSSDKRALIDSYEQAPSLPAIGMQQLTGNWLNYRYRRIELYGVFDNAHQLLLENQIHNSQSGYIVLTPFKLRDGSGYVLVNRGWIERSGDNFVLTAIAVAETPRKITGLVNNPPQVGIKLGSLDDTMPGWPKTVPYVENKWLALQMAADIKPWAIMLVDGEDDGFIRQWKPSVRMGPEKHMGYAFQWFSLALALFIIFIVISYKQKIEDIPRQDEEDLE